MIGSLRWKTFLIITLSLMAAGCDSVAQYFGDGKLVDNGPSAATDRYVLDLGPVSLNAPTSATFRLQSLPKENFVIGIEIRVPAGSKINQGEITSLVSIVLLEDGKTLVIQEAKLDEWTWSIYSPGDYAFVYGRERPGTYFTPIAGKHYELTFKVTEPDRGGANYTASLVAKSGGWK